MNPILPMTRGQMRSDLSDVSVLGGLEMASTSNKSVATTQYHIHKAGTNANPDWEKAALGAVRRLAQKREEFTSADVLSELDDSDTRTHDLRAVGAIMLKARDL